MGANSEIVKDRKGWHAAESDTTQQLNNNNRQFCTCNLENETILILYIKTLEMHKDLYREFVHIKSLYN